MCRVITMEINGRTIKVAEIKKKYIKNIVDAAQKCDCIDRIVWIQYTGTMYRGVGH